MLLEVTPQSVSSRSKMQRELKKTKHFLCGLKGAVATHPQDTESWVQKSIVMKSSTEEQESIFPLTNQTKSETIQTTMNTLPFQYNDGGRSAAGYQGYTGDCVARSIAIASGASYSRIYELINKYSKTERFGKRKRKISSASSGVFNTTIRKVMGHLGARWVSTMGIGTGCRVHLRQGEIPMGRIVCSVSKHYVAVIDGIINDTHDCSRQGTRCVYGYWVF